MEGEKKAQMAFFPIKSVIFSPYVLPMPLIKAGLLPKPST
jgi:hypothetical protein